MAIKNKSFQTDIPLRISIEVPPNAKKTNEIENLFTNLIDKNVPLCIVSILFLTMFYHVN